MSFERGNEMSSLSEEFKRKSNFYYENGASIEEIVKAEKALGLKFSDEYREYLQQYGSVSCGGHELTGISEDANLDVVKVTIANRKKNHSIGEALYVIEETHIDGIVIWQDESGLIYQAEYKEAPEIIFNSLKEYVSSFGADNEIS